MGRAFSKFAAKGFRGDSLPDDVTGGRHVQFQGIAGAFTGVSDLTNRGQQILHKNGWMIWYRGIVTAPKPGRYRFWGYADNNIMVARDSKPIFNGSRFGSELAKDVSCFRQSFPSFPCLNAKVGLSCGEWVELKEGEELRLDILFGESGNAHTSGLLMVEKEGVTYDKTYWGQPLFPLFLTSPPSPQRPTELEAVKTSMEGNLQGSFSIQPNLLWAPVRN